MGFEASFEDRVREIGQNLIEEALERKQHFWAREHWEELVFRRIMSDAFFRVQLLRFIDVLPALRSDAQIALHLDEYLGADELLVPDIIKWGIDHAGVAAAAPVAAAAVRVAMHHLAHRFVGGSTEVEVIARLDHLRGRGLAASLDLLDEVTLSEHEAEIYAERYLAALETLSVSARKWAAADILDTVGGRVAPRVNLSVKLSACYPGIEPAAPGIMVERIKDRVRPLLERARQLGAFVCIDMEHYDLKEISLQVFRELAMEPDFREWPDLGIAMQAYLRETERDLETLIDWAKKRAAPVTVRLVRGAYWDQESVIARQQNWPVPVWREKAETDLNYERCLRRLFQHHPHIETAVGTHNVRSIALALALGEQCGLERGQFELQMLYGMADPLKDAVAKLGHRMRVYVPCGKLLPGMAYLVRRLLENTGSQSFLRMSFAEDRPIEELLAPPQPEASDENQPSSFALPDSEDTPSILHSSSPPPFHNEPVRRFTARIERDRYTSAIDKVRRRLGGEDSLRIHGKHVSTTDALVSRNPARADEIVGRVSAAGESDIDAAVDSATQAFPGWRDLGASERANYLLRTADVLRHRREEFAAWEILEAGKTWREADSDVAEAIDYLEYYAREALRLDVERVLDVVGEINRYGYQPRGVAVILPPWNFPLAIPVGMLGAALAAGNTALLKPAPQTPVVAARFVELMHEIGLPSGVLNFVPGRDDVIGDYLVQHADVHVIAFTGSREVGQRIGELAAHARGGQHHVKRVIAEMGGKNTIIIDDDADLDDAVSGVVASAFGYAGQKCSAASRVVVLEGIYDEFVQRLVEAARSVRVGDPSDPATFVGPVIDAPAQAKIRKAIDEGRSIARVLLETDVAGQGNGYFVGPTILAEAPAWSPLAQEEIFGPVLVVMRATSFDEALGLANSTRYGLTGGLYSRRPSHIERAKREFEVGNLYINRKITGAVVGRQPFGGFKLSGIGSKAGGPDYLLQFVRPRTITENTSRRGFTPDGPR